MRCTSFRTPTAAACGRRCSSCRHPRSASSAFPPRSTTPTSSAPGCAPSAGTTEVIVERHRPIVLRTTSPPTGARTTRRPAASRCSSTASRATRACDRPGRPALPAGSPAAVAARGRAPACPTAPRRTELITALKSEEMLPAIVFIFSRAACDEAVRQVVATAPAHRPRSERAAIRQIAERRVETLSDDDLGVLGYDEWLEGLECGVAAHHAGLVRLQGDGRGVLRRRPPPGGVRHRDAVAGHQHARPLGGDRALHQVRRGRTGHPTSGSTSN